VRLPERIVNLHGGDRCRPSRRPGVQVLGRAEDRRRTRRPQHTGRDRDIGGLARREDHSCRGIDRRVALHLVSVRRDERPLAVERELAGASVRVALSTVDDEKTAALNRNVGRRSRVFSIVPWLKTGEIDPVTTPRPTCMGLPLDPPTVWLTRSMKDTELDLKPIVLMFARLLPITLK
jgi:hypothetical protein